MDKQTIYRKPMSESLFEEEFTVEALSQMGNRAKASTTLTCLVYNIFRYEQLCRCQPALVEKALCNVQG